MLFQLKSSLIYRFYFLLFYLLDPDLHPPCGFRRSTMIRVWIQNTTQITALYHFHAISISVPPLPPPPSRENKIRIGIYLSRLQASPVSGPPTTRQLHDLDNSWVVSDSLRIFTVNIQYRYHCVFICLGCQFVLVLIQKFNTIFVTNLSNGYR